MAKRGDPVVLRQVVIFLRSQARMTQAAFGKAARVDQAEVSRYEMGTLAPSTEVLRRMAKVARFDWSVVVHLRQFYSSLLASASRQNGAPGATALDVMILEPVLLALAPYLLEVQSAESDQPSPEEAHRVVAEQIWPALEKHPARFRRRLIELSPQSGNWALAVQACEASVKSAADEPAEALELAELALSIAERASGDESWRSLLRGYCWAHIGNARRVTNDLAGSEAAFARAWGLWNAEVDSDPILLAEWVLPSMEASLRAVQRRFSEAVELLDRARNSRGGASPASLATLLFQKEYVHEQQGDLQNALTALAEAAPLVEASGDPRQLFTLRFKTANHLLHLKRYDEAAVLLAQVRKLAIQQANKVDMIRVGWLTAKVAAGLRRTEEAVAGLEQVSRDFTDCNLPYDAALSSLDLAVLWLNAGRTAEVKKLAIAMGWIFKAKGIDREALAALRLFCDAARQESATVELARRVIAEVEKVRR